MRKFEFEKSYEEVEIAGKVYKVDFSDERLQGYFKSFETFKKKSEELEKIDIENLSIEQQEELLSTQRGNMKLVTEQILGEGTFDELFELAGRSTFTYYDLLFFLMEILDEKGNKVKDDKRLKYVKKGRK